MKNWWGIAWPISLGVLIGLLAGGLILLASGPARGEAIRLSPPPTASPLMVHVSGAVAKPGVYSLPQGSRVQDAIQAAGGWRPQADTAALNLAAPLADGQRVDVPTKGMGEPASSTQSDTVQSPGGSSVNINTATQAELESLPGIGPALAGRILAYREAHGPFARIEDIQNVEGIGEGTFEKIKGLITVR